MVNVHVGDWGYPFKFKIINKSTGDPFDLTGVTSVTVTFLKPDKTTTVVKEGIVTSSPTQGRIKVDIEENDIDVEGEWEVQVVIASASQRRTLDAVPFKVLQNLPLGV